MAEFSMKPRWGLTTEYAQRCLQATTRQARMREYFRSGGWLTRFKSVGDIWLHGPGSYHVGLHAARSGPDAQRAGGKVFRTHDWASFNALERQGADYRACASFAALDD